MVYMVSAHLFVLDSYFFYKKPIRSEMLKMSL